MKMSKSVHKMQVCMHCANGVIGPLNVCGNCNMPVPEKGVVCDKESVLIAGILIVVFVVWAIAF